MKIILNISEDALLTPEEVKIIEKYKGVNLCEAEDCISRKAAIEAFCDMRDGYPVLEGASISDKTIVSVLKELPSAYTKNETEDCILKETNRDIREEAHNALHNLQELQSLSEINEALVAQVGYNNKRIEELKEGLCGYVGEDIFNKGDEE